MSERCKDLEVAYGVLARLVRGEFPERYTLEQIADVWGDGVTADELAALRRLEESTKPS